MTSPGVGAQLEHQIAEAFRRADYEAHPSVGAEPGTLDWFAMPKTGLVRAKTYFVAWPKAPERLDEALGALEHKRVALGADRALAVIFEGTTPPEAVRDLGALQVLSYRRLVLELSGIADHVRASVREHEQQGSSRWFLPRKAKTAEGSVVDAVEFLERWVEGRPDAPLAIVVEGDKDISSVTYEVAYRVGRRFVESPEVIIPLVMSYAGTFERALLDLAIDNRWVAVAQSHAFHGFDKDEWGARPFLYTNVSALEARSVTRLELLRPQAQDIEEWFVRRLEDTTLIGALLEARRGDRNFKALSELPIATKELVTAIGRAGGRSGEMSVQEWTARVVVSYMSEIMKMPVVAFERGRPWGQIVRSIAMEEFALGRVSTDIQVGIDDLLSYPREIDSWLKFEGPPDADDRRKVEKFSNLLIRDYFVAEHIVDEVRAGNRGILTRYQFPREYVLLFLAILSPEVAAIASADRSAEMRAEVESEVERHLQLTLAHLLRRSVGAAQAEMKVVRRHIEGGAVVAGAALPADVAGALERVEKELSYQSSLAEQTRLWREVPQEEPEEIDLAELVRQVVRPLQGQFSQVAWLVDVDAGSPVYAGRVAVHEILHCLIENAAHAALLSRALPARVTVSARDLGDTVQVEVADSGPGIHPDDRERIFEPYVTTKKGGAGKPRGTGLGLAIARRYAERLGARVGLATDREETCFFATFVAHRAPRGQES